MKTNNFILKSAKVLLLTTALTATSAQAGVISWDYSVVGEFTDSSFTGGGASTTATSLSWGTSTGSGQSSLVIDNSNASGQVNTYYGGGTPPGAFIETGLSLTHNNNPIRGTSLTGATLKTTISLDPLAPNNPALPDKLFDFDIKFAETPNTTGDCADVTSPIPCNDIFILEGGLPNFDFFYDALDGDGLQQYFVNVFITDSNSLSILNDDICSAAGAASGCLGLTTVERQSNLVPFGFTISSDPLSTIPEPASIALFSLGLLLLRIRNFKAS